MPTLNIGNQSVQVDDSFLSLSPDQQNATVDEIANSLGSQGQAQASGGVAAPTTPQEQSSTIGDIAKSAGAGVAEGFAGLVGLPASALNLGAEGIDYLTGKNLESYTQPLADKAGVTAMQGYVAPYLHTPQTQYGKYAETAGSFAPNLIGGPEGLATRLLTRVAAPAAGSELGGQAAQAVGLPESVGQIGGAMLGGAAPGVLGRAVSPLEASAERSAAADVFQQRGIPMDAATATGRMGVLHSELGNTLGAGQQANKAQEATLKGFTQAALDNGGVVGPGGAEPVAMTQDVVNANLQDMKNGFNGIAAQYGPNNPIQLADTLKPAYDDIQSTFEANQGRTLKPLMAYMDRLGVSADNPAPQITGNLYQSVSSNLAEQLRNATNPDTRLALGKFKAALNDAVAPGLADADQGTWQTLRQRWLNHLILENAVNTTTETAAQGLITPERLEQSLNKFMQHSYTRGDQSGLAQLARAGNTLMKRPANSQTAERASSHLIPAAIGAVVGHGFGALPGVITSAAAPAIAGRLLYSRPAQAYLKNQKAAALRKAPTVRNAARAAIFGSQNQ